MAIIRTNAQNSRLHALLSKLGIMDQKADLCHQYSGGRTKSSSQLSRNECQMLINFLKQQQPKKHTDTADKLRKRILSVCHQLGWYQRDKNFNIVLNQKNKPILDIRRIDQFCVQRGKYKKPLNNHNVEELRKLVAQFDQLLYNSVNKSRHSS